MGRLARPKWAGGLVLLGVCAMPAGRSAWSSPVVSTGEAPRSSSVTAIVWQVAETNGIEHPDVGGRATVYGVPGIVDPAVLAPTADEFEFLAEHTQPFVVTGSAPVGVPLGPDELVPRSWDTNAEADRGYWPGQGPLVPSLSSPRPDEKGKGKEKGPKGPRVGLVNLLFGVCIFLIVMLRRRS